MLDLSIVIPTCNRATLLERALASIWRGVACSHEVIVVDGASTDATNVVLSDAADSLGEALRIIDEPRREGFVRAVNRGFRAARGRNVMWLNDDARPLPGSLDAAVEQVDNADATTGMVAIFHRCDVTRNIAYEQQHRGNVYRLLHVRGTLYANFGMARRCVFERLDYFDERFHLYGADPDFSLKVWHAGLSVVPARRSYIDHDEHKDDRRASDSAWVSIDNEKLFAKWDLPPKSLHRNDFDPAQPCTLRGLRQALSEAA